MTPPRGDNFAASSEARKFPSGARYSEALQHPKIALRDSILSGGTVVRGGVLGPKAISGNFASVFSITGVDGKRYALKCFTRDVPGLGRRYALISEAVGALEVARLSQPWRVEFSFLDDGIHVGGTWFPALKMSWAEGQGLTEWIDRHHADRAALEHLVERFYALALDLSANNIAHGDLQHGNILVAPDGTLRLVDYDGMYVPALQGEPSTESGHRNYQSPRRRSADFGPHVDRFSAWIIHLSLLAIAADSLLWRELHDPEGEYLILGEEDYRSPDSSLAWNLLLNHVDSRLRSVASQVRGFLSHPLEAIPLLALGPVVQQIPLTSVGKTMSTAGIPSWMAKRVAVVAEPQSRRQGYVGRRRSDALASLSGLLALGSPGSLAAISVIPLDYLPAGQAVGAGAALAALAIGRQSRIEYQRVAGQIRRIRAQLADLGAPQKAYEGLTKELRRLDDASAKDAAAADQKLRSVQIGLRDEVARIKVVVGQRSAKLQREVVELPSIEKQRIQAALAPEIDAHVRGILRNISINGAIELPNMGAKTIGALRASGIVTAADFAGVSYSASNSYGSTTVYLVLPTGRFLHVSGIGEARAGALESWRQAHERRARLSAPKAVPQGVKQRIQSEISARRAALEHQIKQFEIEAGQRIRELQANASVEQQRITTEQRHRETHSGQQRSETLRKRTALENDLAVMKQLRARLNDERGAARRALGLKAYIRFLMRG